MWGMMEGIEEEEAENGKGIRAHYSGGEVRLLIRSLGPTLIAMRRTWEWLDEREGRRPPEERREERRPDQPTGIRYRAVDGEALRSKAHSCVPH